MTDLLADRYELGATLGSGGMARVVAAHDRLLDRKVAVKVLRDDVVSEAGGRERFLREARAAASFSHPNAVGVYDIGRDGGTSFIVMELVEGATLADVLAEQGALEAGEAVATASGVLAALAAAHDRGLVHRDVKPANILLPGGQVPTDADQPGGAKLADFGIAKGIQEATAGLTATGQVLGTPKYLSPEQVGGDPATPASDVYAAGVVLYEMLAGRPPFDAESALAVALAHRNDPVPRLDRARRGLDPDLVRVVHRALNKDPARRFADAASMRAALRRGVGLAPVAAAGAAAATTVSLPPRQPTRTLPAHPASGPRAWPVALVVGALALLALLAFGLTQSGEQATPPTSAPTGAQDRPAATEEPRDTAQQAEEEPTAEPTAPAEQPLPGDLAGLIGLLSTNPDAYGEKTGDLLDGLQKVAEERGATQHEEASKLVEEIDKWVSEGGLDPEVGGAAQQILAPLADRDPDRGADNGGNNDGNGRGGGEDEDEDD